MIHFMCVRIAYETKTTSWDNNICLKMYEKGKNISKYILFLERNTYKNHDNY